MDEKIKMHFALNYSPQAAELLAAGEIEIDYFKTPPWSEMVAKAQKHRPVAVHFALKAGTGQIYDTDWALVEHLLDKTDTRYVNVHLAAYANEFPGIDSDSPQETHKAQLIENMHSDLSVVINHFGAERVIVENSPYRVGEQRIMHTCALPEVITKIILEHQCGLLLDIAHARISADALGMNTKDYLEALPIRYLQEMHFTGLHDIGNGHLMDHLPILEEDWPWLDWVMENIENNDWGKPHLLAYEYGGEGHGFFGANSDKKVIARDVPRLYDLCHNNEKTQRR